VDEPPANLEEQYRRAIEEYRFQVDLNWRRSEYFFVLNIGVLVAAATLLASEDLPRALVGLVFGLGALLASLSLLANNTQHSYYKSARGLKEKLEDQLQLGEFALRTTPGMGSKLERLGRVGTFLKTMLVAIAFVDIVGAGISAHAAFDSDPRPPNLVKVVMRLPGTEREFTAVISQGGKVIAARTIAADEQMKPLSLEPGKYRVSILGRSICTEEMEVTTAPLQLTNIACGKT
jgi:hypothetical protein